MPRDDLRNREDTSGFIGGGEGPGGGVQNLGSGSGTGGGGVSSPGSVGGGTVSGGSSPYGPEMDHLSEEPAGGAVRQRAEDAKDELKDRAIEEGKKRVKEGVKKGGGKGAEQGATGAGRAAGTAAGEAATGAAGEAAAGGAAGAGAGAGAGTTAAGAGATAAGAAGAEAAAGTAAAGTAAAGAGAGAAAGGVAAGGTAVGAGVAVTTGVETAGIGAAVGVGIIVVAGATAAFVKYRKEIAALAAVLFVGALLLVAALLNGLKPIASTLQTAQKYLSPVQQIVDNRSVEVIGRFITGGSGAALAYDQQQKEQVAKTNAANTNSGQVLPAGTDGLVESGKLKILFDAMQADGFEARLKEKYGLEFKPGTGGIAISRYGQPIGTAANGRDAAELLRIGFPDLQRMLSEDTPYWSWAQHNKGALNMKGQYDVPALAVPGGESAYDGGQLTEIVKYQVSTILRTGLTNMKRGIACFTGGTECNDFGVQVGGEAVAEYQNDNRSSLTATTQAAYDENLKNISPENGYDSPRLDTSAGRKVTAQLEQQTVGLLGWLDIAATTKKMSEKEGAQQLPSILRGKQAGSLWLWNLSAVNQMLAKDMTSPASSLITRNYQSIEDSQAYNYVAYDDPLRGLAMSESKKINSKLKNAFSYFYQSLLIENPILQGAVGLAFDGWLVIHNTFAGFLIDLAARTPFGTFVDRFAGFILDQVGALEFVSQVLGISSKTTLPVCDPTDKTYDFFNCMASGSRNAANFMCAKFFGCGIITLAQENELKVASARDMNARLAAMPWHKRMFDPKVPSSFINVAAMNSPLPIKATNNVASMFQGVFGAVWTAPGKIAALSAAPARAANSDGSLIDGQETMGIPLQTLQNATLPAELENDQGICPETKLGEEINTCMAAFSTVDAMIAFHKKDPNYNTAFATVPVTAPGPTGDASALAKSILENKNITYWKEGSKNDLEATRDGTNSGTVENQCGGNTKLSPDLLHVINEAGKKYRFMITSLVSDHHCNEGYHPQGKAFDLDLLNGTDATASSLGTNLYKNFIRDASGWIKSVSATGGFGQRQCTGRLDLPAGITQLNDTCNHLHISIGGREGSI